MQFLRCLNEFAAESLVLALQHLMHLIIMILIILNGQFLALFVLVIIFSIVLIVQFAIAYKKNQISNEAFFILPFVLFSTFSLISILQNPINIYILFVIRSDQFIFANKRILTYQIIGLFAVNDITILILLIIKIQELSIILPFFYSTICLYLSISRRNPKKPTPQEVIQYKQIEKNDQQITKKDHFKEISQKYLEEEKKVQEYKKDPIQEQNCEVQEKTPASIINSFIQINFQDQLSFEKIDEKYTWNQKLESFPLGIMIVNKQNLNITYLNDFLRKMFEIEEIVDFNKFLLKEIQFRVLKRQITQMSSNRKVSLKKIMKKKQIDFQQQIASQNQPEFQQCSLIKILQQYHNNELNEYINKQNKSMEIYAEVENKKYTSVNIQLFNQVEESFQFITGKIISNNNEQDTLILFQDITKQNQLSKLKIKEQFKQKFINSFSHELRTPLNSASNFLVAGLDSVGISINDKEKYLKPALNSLRLQSYLINDIIDFTQFFSDLLVIESDYFKIEELLEDLTALFYVIFKMKNIGFQIYIKNKLPENLFSDYRRLLQILVNLIQNSIKFTNSGFVTLEIKKAKNNSIQFIIKDEGIGITAQKLDQIRNCLNKLYNLNDITIYDEWNGFGLIISQILIQKLAPIDYQLLNIQSNGENLGTQVSFRIDCNSQGMSSQFDKRKISIFQKVQSQPTFSNFDQDKGLF